MGGPAKVARALRRLRGAAPDHSASAVVLAAAAALPAWARGGAPAPAPPVACLVHGDFHLGQLVHLASPGCDRSDGWRLIDVDDLGSGDPVWDLARPAAWYAAGLLPRWAWERFLLAYREAGGCALPPDPSVDPWTVLEMPARALVVQLAALGVARAAEERRAPDEAEELLLAACNRIHRLPRSVQVSRVTTADGRFANRVAHPGDA
jgi:aminoglycoside phosphotransferase (APT) family kinase protein